MAIESDLFTVLSPVCPRVYPDVAPAGAQRPYITYQLLGGRALRWLDKTAADKRHTIAQFNVWASTRLAANALARQIEDALCASTVFTATPQGEPMGAHSEELDLYGTMQDFTIYSSR